MTHALDHAPEGGRVLMHHRLLVVLEAEGLQGRVHDLVMTDAGAHLRDALARVAPPRHGMIGERAVARTKERGGGERRVAPRLGGESLHREAVGEGDAELRRQRGGGPRRAAHRRVPQPAAALGRDVTGVVISGR